MKELFRNPHTFDMSSYLNGDTYVVGGRDFEREENDLKKEVSPSIERDLPIKMDWSFLKNLPQTQVR